MPAREIAHQAPRSFAHQWLQSKRLLSILLTSRFSGASLLGGFFLLRRGAVRPEELLYWGLWNTVVLSEAAISLFEMVVWQDESRLSNSLRYPLNEPHTRLGSSPDSTLASAICHGPERVLCLLNCRSARCAD